MMFAERGGSRAIKAPRGKALRKWFVLFAVAFGFVPCHGQTAQPAPQAPTAQTPASQTPAIPAPAIQAPSVTVTTEEVSVDLVVHDKKQRSVLDLKPEEVAITDNGDPVKITSLRLINSGSGNDHLITLLFDHLNPTVKKNAAAIAAKILKATPEGEFSLAVLKVEPGRLGLLQAFTSDRNALDQAIAAAIEPDKSSTSNALEKAAEAHLSGAAEAGADLSGGRVSARGRSLARILLTAINDSARLVQDQHTQSYLSELLALADAERELPGRKAMFYFTQGTYTDSRGKNVMQSIISAANRAGMNIYTVDLTAISQAGNDSPSDLTSDLIGRTLNGMASGPAHSPNPSPPSAGEDYSTRAQMEGMTGSTFHDRSPGQEIALGTGGTYVDGTHNVQKPLQRMIQDMTTYYEASYQPLLHEYDGKFRPVAVAPLRKGLKIRAREGYFALPPDSASGIQPFELPLLNILSGAQLPNALPFRAAILRLGEIPNEDGNSLAIEIPLAGVDIREDASTNLYSGQISILAQIKDKSGRVIEKFSEDVPCRGALEQLEKARSQTVTLQRHFDAPPGQYVLEAVIMDRVSGKASARQINFEIPAISGGPSFGDVVLVGDIEPFQIDTDPREPLWNGSGKVTPNLSGEMAREAKDASVFFVTHTDQQSPEPATLAIQMLKDGSLVKGMSTASKQLKEKQAVAHLANFPLTSLPDGVYEVKVTLTQGEKTTSATTSFTLAGREPITEEVESGNDNGSAPTMEASIPPPSITFSTGSVQPPAQAQIKSILGAATDRAIKYGLSLPNLICTQVTNRSVDPSGKGKWKHQDSITERLTYLNNVEKRTILTLNGNPTKVGAGDLIGALSEGEFGSILKAIFEPSSKPDFHWKEGGMLGNGKVDVFDYVVSHENSTFLLSRNFGANQSLLAGLHGEIFLDSATHGVRRLTVVADDLPRTFFIEATSVSVDYDYVVINGHDYLLPIRAQVGLKQRGHQAMLNEIEFRDYRRFGSKVKITPVMQK